MDAKHKQALNNQPGEDGFQLLTLKFTGGNDDGFRHDRLRLTDVDQFHLEPGKILGYPGGNPLRLIETDGNPVSSTPTIDVPK